MVSISGLTPPRHDNNQSSAAFESALINNGATSRRDDRLIDRKLDELFDPSIDTNGNGKLEAKELAKALNISVKEAREIIRRFDDDGDEELDKKEAKNFFGALLEFTIATLNFSAEIVTLNSARPNFLRDLTIDYLARLDKRPDPVDSHSA